MNIINKYTIRILKKNKVRTLITIIGIILSISMITAVTTFISSLKQFLINTSIENDGDWYGAVSLLNEEELKQLTGRSEVTDYAISQNIGYADVNSLNENKPYLFLLGVGEGFEKNMPIHLIEGRLPKDSTELLLPKHLQTNGGVTYELGEQLILEVGDRKLEDATLYQNTELVASEGGVQEEPVQEELVVKETKTYTVVGFYERPNYEYYSAPGYTALTIEDNTKADSYNIYLKTKDAKDIYSLLENNYEDKRIDYNSEYLRLINGSNNSSYNRVLNGLATILIVIIMFGSISLIYNAFSISVSERMKQFGLISSIGATKRQILHSVLFEGLALSVIGIPFGIISGIAGIGVTLAILKNLFLSFMNSRVTLNLYVTPWSVVIAAIVGIITVMISAYLPAKRAVKVPTIEAIRLTSDINIKAKKVKTSWLTYKLFGFEGMIASKNFKRNRKKYRATVISLFMSIVLFISASSLCAYLTKSVTTVMDDRGYEISYMLDSKNLTNITLEELINSLSKLEGITDSSYMYNVYSDLYLKEEYIEKNYLTYLKESYGGELEQLEDGRVNIPSVLYFIDDATYENFAKEKGYFVEEGELPHAIALDTVKFYNPDLSKYHSFRALKGKDIPSELIVEKYLDDYYKTETYTDEQGNVIFVYENNQGETLQFPKEEMTKQTPVKISEITETGPTGVGTYYGNMIILLFPYSEREAILGHTISDETISLFFKTKNHTEVYNKLYQTLEELKLPTQDLYDALERQESERAMITVIRVFSYGFITLISLIAAANVFNTISTNIALRRVEFAMLKSVGMTSKGFHKMMNYECILYGIKGILYGIPVSILVTYWIYQSILQGLDMAFFIPWSSIVIAIGSVFVVVFATMLFSMSKIKKENTIDALKNENI